MPVLTPDPYSFFHSPREIQGPLGKFVDSPYSSESELCGGAVTVSLKHLPWQAMHFVQYPTHFLKMCCRPFATSFRRIVVQVVLTFHVCFPVSKALPPLENCSSSHCIISIGLMDEGFRIQSHNADAPLRKYLVAPPS
jgi:hypothetical protein